MQDAGVEFRGTARPWWAWMCWVAVIAVFYGGEMGLVRVLHPSGRHDTRVLSIMVFGLAVAVATVPLSKYLDSRPITVRLNGSGVELGRFGTASRVGGPPPGRWWQRGVGTTIGGVLHIRTRYRSVRIGARGRDAAPPGVGGPAATSVHITLSAADFDRLVAVLHRGVPTPPRPIELYASGGTSISQGLVLIPTLFVGGFLVACTAELAMLARHPTAGLPIAIAGAIAILIVLAIETTVLSARHPGPKYLLEFSAGEALVYAPSRRCLARGRPRYRRGSRAARVGAQSASSTVHVPAIELTVPPLNPLLIELPDRMHWSATPTFTGPYLTIGTPDCARLLTALGLPAPHPDQQ
ncbi:hypothetical protein [Nocardia sp. NBC_00511]|uniref:hypothetical protein n=1 Tax=Nocardia sp. NBC_00511 TaxID=2903591 RepID=UPI0030E3F49B